MVIRDTAAVHFVWPVKWSNPRIIINIARIMIAGFFGYNMLYPKKPAIIMYSTAV